MEALSRNNKAWSNTLIILIFNRTDLLEDPNIQGMWLCLCYSLFFNNALTITKLMCVIIFCCDESSSISSIIQDGKHSEKNSSLFVFDSKVCQFSDCKRVLQMLHEFWPVFSLTFLCLYIFGAPRNKQLHLF